MRLRLYAILDKAVEAYHPPLVFRSEGEAKRSFIDAISGQGQIASHKEDFAFCFLGFYEDTLARFECASPIVVLEGATCLAAPEFADLAKDYTPFPNAKIVK